MTSVPSNGHRGHPSEIDFCRPTYCEINISALEHNYRTVRSLLPASCRLLAVVKANAYGHGVRTVAKYLDELGTDWFGVATVAEGVELRQLGIKKPILVMGALVQNALKTLSEWNLTATVHDLRSVDLLSSIDTSVSVHIKVDTGMHRLGIYGHELEKALTILKCAENISVEGIFSHLGHADTSKHPINEKQRRTFLSLANKAESLLGRPLIKHLGNSGWLLTGSQEGLDMIRIGILLYGSFPSKKISKNIDLKSVLSLKSRIVQIKEVPKGGRVGYDGPVMTKTTKIAVLPIGYADGLLRVLGRKGIALLNGHMCQIIGNVCMDMTMIDISSIKPVSIGDEVTLIGGPPDYPISALTLAEKAGTASYEIFTSISERVPRIPI